MAHPHRTYQPRDTEHSVLHAVIREHLEPFLREPSDRGDGHGLPRFVEQEFREFLTCGVLAHGFTPLRGADCTFERLLPFSCKRRGFCPSCGGRRMAARAAYLVDEVLPRVPVRQWVLTLPYRVRYRLARDHALCRAVLGVYARVLLAFYARSAHAQGIRDGQTGTVTVIQRFGTAVHTATSCTNRAWIGCFVRFRAVATEPPGARASRRCPRRSPATTPDGAPGNRCARLAPARA